MKRIFIPVFVGLFFVFHSECSDVFAASTSRSTGKRLTSLFRSGSTTGRPLQSGTSKNVGGVAGGRGSTSSAPNPVRIYNSSAPVIPGLGEGIPNYILGEIRSLDHKLKCFPKLLCTIYQDDSVLEKMGSFNATELGTAYIKLLKAVHYTSRFTTTTIAPPEVKPPIIQVFQIPAGLITAATYSGRKDHVDEDDDVDNDDHHSHHLDDLADYPHHLRSPLDGNDYGDEEGDDDDIFNDNSYDDRFKSNPRRRDFLHDNGKAEDSDREFLREKLEITKMLEESKEEDNGKSDKEFSSSPSSHLATSLLSPFYPFSRFSRSIKDKTGKGKKAVDVDWKKMEQLLREEGDQREEKEKMRQDPFWRAVSFWRRLTKRSECQKMYEACPFEAWEIVRMLDLVKGQSQLLSAYLKVTVDNADPSTLRI